MRALKFNFQPNVKRLFNQRHHFGVRGIKMFHEQFAAVDRICQGNHSGGKNITGPKFPRLHNGISAHDVRHQAAYLLIISDVVAREFGISLCQFCCAHPNIAIIELFRA